MSDFWSFYIILLVVLNIGGCALLLMLTRKKKESAGQGETTGHIYDGIEEYDNPLPQWWLWMFYITIIFSVIYLILYPGLGSYKGALNWTQVNQYQEEVEAADAVFLPKLKQYAALSYEELLSEPEALAMGQSIFANTCFGCHGADARGSLGYPNLTDDEWLYGGSQQAIEHSILKGRQGMMPAWSQVLDTRGLNEVTHYILSQNEAKRAFIEGYVEEGEKKYQALCAACHGMDLSGNQALGAPNLKDSIWLHGGSEAMIKQTIAWGIKGNMPPHEAILGKEKSHLVGAYIFSLSKSDK